MSAYADTSFLVSYFGQDAKTLAAYAYAATWSQPPRIAWTVFGELEFNNAVRSLVFSGQLTPGNLRAMHARVDEDLRGGILATRALPAYRHYEMAEAISAQHTARVGGRTLDLLHVAAARVLGAREFLTFDARQRQLAILCGLRVLP